MPAPLRPTGFLKITGRAKEIIVTSSGKNITPTGVDRLAKKRRFPFLG